MSTFKNKKAIFLDFGDTIASTVPTYPDRVRISLLNMGFDFTTKDYFNAFQYGDYVIYKKYMEEGKVSSYLYQQTMTEILIEELSLNMQFDNPLERIKNELKNIEFTRELLPGARELLDNLYEKGYKLGIISNNDGKTRQKCEELGIDNFFEVIIDSTNVRKIKPDKKIFDLATGRLGIETKDIVHIGDLYGADILAGRNAGLDVIWINHRKGLNYENIEVKQVENLFELIELF